MIRYLTENEKKCSRKLYCEAFPEDPTAFVDYYYSYVVKDNKILVLEQEGEICSMLHLNPYRLKVGGYETDAYYYVAVATRQDCRHRGMMRKLLIKSLKDIYKEGHPFTYLMPADKAIYEPFDFRIIYRQKKVELPVNPDKANERMAELFEVYTLRDDWYVEKMLEEERVCEGNQPFDIVPYIMVRITHVEKMLSMLRSEEELLVMLNIRDEIIPENRGLFQWEISRESSCCKRVGDFLTSEAEKKEILLCNSSSEVLTVSLKNVHIAELTEFVFGKRTIEGLESVRVFSKICINESV